LPVALAARTRSPTAKSAMDLTVPDSRRTVSDPAKQELVTGDPLLGSTVVGNVGTGVVVDSVGFNEGVTVGDDAVRTAAGAEVGARGGDAVGESAGAEEGATVGDDAVGESAGAEEGATVGEDAVGATVGADEGVGVVSSAVTAGALTVAVKPLDDPTVFNAVVSDVTELVRAVVVSACVSCVSTSYVTLTDDDEDRTLNPFLVKLRLRLAVTAVIEVIVIAFGSRSRAVAVAAIKAVWNEFSEACKTVTPDTIYA
jgi:hypothetical protein